jgi:hypothetical protein
VIQDNLYFSGDIFSKKWKKKLKIRWKWGDNFYFFEQKNGEYFGIFFNLSVNFSNFLGNFAKFFNITKLKKTQNKSPEHDACSYVYTTIEPVYVTTVLAFELCSSIMFIVMTSRVKFLPSLVILFICKWNSEKGFSSLWFFKQNMPVQRHVLKSIEYLLCKGTEFHSN